MFVKVFNITFYQNMSMSCNITKTFGRLVYIFTNKRILCVILLNFKGDQYNLSYYYLYYLQIIILYVIPTL